VHLKLLWILFKHKKTILAFVLQGQEQLTFRANNITDNDSYNAIVCKPSPCPNIEKNNALMSHEGHSMDNAKFGAHQSFGDSPGYFMQTFGLLVIITYADF
jgi:hypothetical protein